jgi:hypothetical protein
MMTKKVTPFTRTESEVLHREARIAGIRSAAERLRAERFWAKVEKTDTCWLWRGQLAVNGYGLVGYRGEKVGAHRVSLILSGQDPGLLHVCHRCDVRNCVRPDHLFLGTRSDNMRDMESKGRGSPLRARRGEQHGRAKLTADIVRACRVHAAMGVSVHSLANLFGVCQQVMRNAVLRRTWRTVE